MGTHATVLLKGDNFKWKIYFQYDGYYEGVGKELAEFFTEMKIGNGIPGGYNEEEHGRFGNGFECAALQYLAEVKQGAGGVYATDLDDHQEYNYELWHDGEGFHMKAWCEYGHESPFQGSPDRFLEKTGV